MATILLFLFAWCAGMTFSGLAATLIIAWTGREIFFVELIGRERLPRAVLLSAVLGPVLALNEGLVEHRSPISIGLALVIANVWAVASGIALISFVDCLT